MPEVLVIGGGAAGCMAAIIAATNGAKVTLWEKNDKLGKKLRITGKGRCNLTNACSIDEIIRNLPGNGRFMYSAINNFSNTDTMEFFEKLGVALKVERGQRVFPVTDKASTVIDALETEMLSRGVIIKYNTCAKELLVKDGAICGAVSQKGHFNFDAVILATGGATYKATGSNGDGYKLVADLGHSITPILPSLVPLLSSDAWLPQLSGLALRNSKISLWRDFANQNGQKKQIATDFGELLFTHFGLSGPVILSLSKAACKFWQKHPQEPLKVIINLKPALSEEQLDARIQRDFLKSSRKHFMNSLDELLPKSLIPVVVQLSGIPEDCVVHQITKAQRLALVNLLREFAVTVTAPAPLDQAIVTAGGISLKEIDPKTFESKLVKGLFAVGEVLDVDGFTGGYNLQAAFSSGYAAGFAAATK